MPPDSTSSCPRAREPGAAYSISAVIVVGVDSLALPGILALGQIGPFQLWRNHSGKTMLMSMDGSNWERYIGKAEGMWVGHQKTD